VDDLLLQATDRLLGSRSPLLSWCGPAVHRDLGSVVLLGWRCPAGGGEERPAGAYAVLVKQTGGSAWAVASDLSLDLALGTCRDRVRRCLGLGGDQQLSPKYRGPKGAHYLVRDGVARLYYFSNVPGFADLNPDAPEKLQDRSRVVDAQALLALAQAKRQGKGGSS